MFEMKNSFLDRHSKFFPALAKRLSVLMTLLVVALMTTLCAQAQTIDPHSDWTWNVLTLSGNLPVAAINEAYNAVLTVNGGRSPYHFSVRDGVLPSGITLNPATGTLSGTPSTTGTFSFYVSVTDSRHEAGSHAFGIVVRSGGETLDVHVSPTSTSLSSNQNQQFTAAVSGTSNTGVTWSATSGSVNASGLYAAPTVTATTSVVVTATSVADSSKFASAAITVNPATNQALRITTGNLPQGQQGDTYSEVFGATGGTAPYRWSISAGTPPAGLTMNTSGDFAGMPTAAGTSNFTVTVADSTSKTASGNFSATILAGGNYDGPAELPRVTVSSAMADTPAPGPIISVKSGGDLQAALNNAQCGNTIELQAGATFSGVFTFPAQNCDSGHWIIVRTSAPDTSLPAEGQRLTPCYAGVASLPGRPQYPCNNPQNVLAKLIVSGSEDVLISFQSGANHYRLLGLELTRPTGTKGAPTLISVYQGGNGGTASYIVLDRSWVHGTKQDDTRDGFALAGTNSVAVVDSYFSDFHCTAGTGSCTDSHAVSGGNGTHQDGPYEIRDNFLEASGEAVLFGGASGTTTPTDITIHFNHFFKPWQWMPGSSPFQGGDSGNPFVVKNHLELKNAARVLAETNLMENVWGGFSQTGFGILLTPKNQHTKSGTNVCPICQVTDVTVRYTHIIHAGGGIAMANVTSLSEGGAQAKAGERYSIHDVVMDDISTNYVGLGRLFLVASGWQVNPLNTFTINHITGFPDATNGGVLIMGNDLTNPSMYGFVMTNSLVTTGRYPIWNVGGGDASCAASSVPVKSINKCFTTNTFNDNALIMAPAAFPPSVWPTGNRFESNPNNVGFVAYGNGNGGNYQLQSNSPYKNKGSDGKDLGADIVGLNEALAGVE